MSSWKFFLFYVTTSQIPQIIHATTTKDQEKQQN